jgi:cell wall-associated NlpC family hydrolase
MDKDDKRLNAFRGEAEGTLRQCRVAVTSIRKLPRFDAPQLSEALMGEVFRVFDDNEGWSFVQSERDRYVGFVSSEALGDVLATTHKVIVPSTFSYPTASIKTQPAEWLPMLAEVTVTGTDGKFMRLTDGRFIWADHLAPLAKLAGDYVAIAERFLNVPYYWGGKTARGLDCSGLVQVALQASGVEALRDSDMQEESLGQNLMINDLDSLARGDLVFWDGHVGIMVDNAMLLHANGHHMQVVKEPLKEAVARIKAGGSEITHIKRL